MYKRIHAYDLDGVLVDTSHRYRNKINGSIDMEYWQANHTAEKIAQDTLLPHAEQYRQDTKNPEVYTIICTVRSYHYLDVAFISKHLGNPSKLFMLGQHRPPYTKDSKLKLQTLSSFFGLRQFKNLPRTLWEDNLGNIETLQHLFDNTIYVPSYITGK